MTEPLHIVRLVLDRRELARLARRHRLGRNVDEGYLLHAGLAQLFATSSEPAHIPLHPFTIDDTLRAARGQPQLVFLLAYSAFGEDQLLRLMGPARQALVRTCDTRPVPEILAGTRVAFRVRVCPIVRTRQPVMAGPGRAGELRGKVREVDAWLGSAQFHEMNRATATGEALPFEHAARVWSGREAVYGEWLGRELGRNGSATLDGRPELTSFKRDRLYRRNPEAGHLLERPNAIMEGLLRVADEDEFRSVLRRGLGRHRAFGFGMLLLRSVGG